MIYLVRCVSPSCRATFAIKAPPWSARFDALLCRAGWRRTIDLDREGYWCPRCR